MGVQSIGMPVRREEDFRLLRGKGRYVDDVRLPREARGYVVSQIKLEVRAPDHCRDKTVPVVQCRLNSAPSGCDASERARYNPGDNARP
jgi:hypothetical protein